MAKTPHLVQYQGSKRNLAAQILPYMPWRFERMIEPFAGSAAVTIAVASDNRATQYLINDINEPLINLLKTCVDSPEWLANAYAELWQQQFHFGEGHVKHFYEVRKRFNNGDASPANMLYLLARCVKGAVRYGRNGAFNQSPDKRRHGTIPQTIAQNIYAISELLRNKTLFFSRDYREILGMARPGDIVYMDPPYQGISGVGDPRYIAGIDFGQFAASLAFLDSRGIDYIISYDGECGGKSYGYDLPETLNCKKVMLNAGLSTQALLLGRRSVTIESLYVSRRLYKMSVESCDLPLFHEG